jgi:hypothetical protein
LVSIGLESLLNILVRAPIVDDISNLVSSILLSLVSEGFQISYRCIY